MYKLHDNTNYYAEIVQLTNRKPHPNADRLVIWNIHGFDVITDLSYNEGDVCVYFPLECEINPLFLAYLNMFSDSNLNDDKTSKGYMHKSGRVRAVKLRDVLSDGIVIKFESFAKWASAKGYTVKADVGAKFNDVDKLWVCKKYIPVIKEARNSGTGPKPKVKLVDFLVDGQFAFHEKTKHLQKEIDILLPTDIISVSHKLHGTSAVYANVLVNRKLNIFEKLMSKLVNIQKQVYSNIYSSRTVLKYIESAYSSKESGFYNTDVWGTVYKDIKSKIKKGFTLYGEIVGIVNGKQIQSKYDYRHLMIDKTYEFFVYKITYTTPEGIVIELNWQQMEDYCRKNELQLVPCEYYGQASVRFPYFQDNVDEWRKSIIETLKVNIEKDCIYCNNKVPFEGVVLRIEQSLPIRLKMKSQAFKVMESKQLDTEEVNIEDAN
jgi:RNA ligase (TIGR02306 family)